MTETILALLIAVRVVESTDGLDIRAQGNNYQITRVCLEDVNRIYKTKYRWPEDTRNEETAQNIALLYLTYYGMVYEREYGRVPTTDILARIWNCGYRGFKRGDKRGDAYVRKIRRAKKKFNNPIERCAGSAEISKSTLGNSVHGVSE